MIKQLEYCEVKSYVFGLIHYGYRSYLPCAGDSVLFGEGFRNHKRFGRKKRAGQEEEKP